MSYWPLILALVLISILLWRVWPTPLARLFLTLDQRYGRLRTRTLTSGEINWHYLEGGHGEPLVLLHGFNADSSHFCRVSRHLAAHFRILAPDLPGFGLTASNEIDSFRVEDLADRVLAWLDDVGIHDFYLGGNSMGGYIAVAMARRAPERVRALWLLAPGGLRTARLSAVLEQVAEERHNPLVIRNQADFYRLVDYCFVRPPWIPGPLARHLARRAALTAVRAQRIFDAMRYDSLPLEDMARGLATPSLIVWGQADQVLHPEGARLLDELMADSRCLILPSIGHLPMLEDPRNVAESWLSFTESLAREEQSSTSEQQDGQD
ncbi:MAG: alpha/beta fold hydrolase [Wenzhouxiangella sp.]|nr:MAG: alpha/beta fold hydrolase [Wenzhouxiangella sp.]